MIKAYKYRLLPTEDQKAILANWFGSCRFVYNLGLETKIAAWKSAQKSVGCYELGKQLTELKKHEAPWLADCPAVSLESALANLDIAYTNFFNGSGFPRFKKRSNDQSIHFRQSLSVSNGRVRLTKIGWIDFIEHRKLAEGQIRSATVSKKPSGNYYVSILIKDDSVVPDKKPISLNTTVGIDMGLKTFAVLSDGQTFDNPKYLHQQLGRLKKEQRTLARRFKRGVKISEQSKGYHKQRLVVAKLQETISNKRQDFLHKTSTAIIKQYDTICLEDLNIKGMIQNRKLSKAISDVSWYEFNRMLEYKAEWYGKNIKRIGRFDPSSKTCSNCGNYFKELSLSVRGWTCENCGSTHDRDLNAAKNIKSFGSKARPSTANARH